MPEPILRTKLFIPPPRPTLIPRPALIDRLETGLALGRKLTLISAPAGFGKTTLISTWLAHNQRPAAWLSLDERDNDPARFLTYLVAALQTIQPTLGDALLAALQTPQLPPVETLLTPLLNELTAVADPILLVLDDLHIIQTRTIADAITFLLAHLPPHLHLVITSREDPQLPLARMRVRGQLTELRAADLRFSPTEAAAFLNDTMGLSLSTAEITALDTRTEGWIAGLQMAALSMQGRTDTAGFVQAFTGSHHYVLDYLVEEVLQRQPEPVRHFLLQTAVLDQLCGPLCDAVTGRSDSHDMLIALQRSNLFLVPLDDERVWYRYHHLFANVLQAHAAEQPLPVTELHGRASAWYAQNGRISDAIAHALSARDFERAADLIEGAWPAMDANFQGSTWLHWVAALPPELPRRRPVMLVAMAWAVLVTGQLETAAAHLQQAEQWLTNAPDTPDGMVVADTEQFQTLPASIAAARAYIAQAHGDVTGTIAHAQQALALLPADAYVRRGPPASILGLAYWGQGELDEAFQALSEAMDGFRRAGALSFAISGTYGLADIRLAQGRLRAAVDLYEQALRLVPPDSQPPISGTSELYLGLSLLQREMGNPQAAERYLRKSEALGEQAALGNWPYRWRVAKAQFAQDDGDLATALDLLDQAERLYFRTPVPNLRPVAALRVRVWLAQGRLAEALAWMRACDLPATTAPSFLREFDLLTIARVLLAHYRQTGSPATLQEALDRLARLQTAAETGRRMGSLIEVSLVQALAHAAAGDTSVALAALERALQLAAPEGYVRVFVDEGPRMADLIRTAVGHHILPTHARHILAAFPATDAPTAPTSQPLIDPLSDRELEVLRLIADGLTNREISERLFVALSTIKGHNSNIFDKLQVKRRTEAVARARELGLL